MEHFSLGWRSFTMLRVISTPSVAQRQRLWLKHQHQPESDRNGEPVQAMGLALLSFGPGLSEQLEQTPPVLSGLGQCRSGYIRKQRNSSKKTMDYR